jgi:hypothetical protein
MVSQGGVILAAFVGGAAALLALVVVKLWPKDNDTLAANSTMLVGRWRRFTGLDD